MNIILFIVVYIQLLDYKHNYKSALYNDRNFTFNLIETHNNYITSHNRKRSRKSIELEYNNNHNQIFKSNIIQLGLI